MALSRFNRDQKIAALKMAKAGKSITDVCCEYKISNATFFAWRRKFDSKEVPLQEAPQTNPSAEPNHTSSDVQSAKAKSNQKACA